MVNISINGVDTTREENEIYREFVNSNKYSYCKMFPDLDKSREVIEEWFNEMNYKFSPDNKAMIEHIAFKI